MKHSKTVALTAMGLSALVLTACSESQTPAAVYETVRQCVAGGKFTEVQCRGAMLRAKFQHATVSPKYRIEADCEADFGSGNCESTPHRSRSGNRLFMPLMKGYMFGRTADGRRTAAAQPLYRAGNDPGTYRNADNLSVSTKTGLIQVPESVMNPPSPKRVTVPRGGFGAGARTYRSGGGTRQRHPSYGG